VPYDTGMTISARFALLPALILVVASWPGPTSAAAPTRCLGLPASIIGTPGDDNIEGTPGDDVIAAGGGDDHVDARRGDDVICAGAGADEVHGGLGADVLHGERGEDELFAGGDADDLVGGRGVDLLVGGDAADALFGGGGADILRAGAGFDGPLIGGDDDDVVDGGTDGGTASFLFASRGVTADLSMGTATGEGQDGLFGVGSVVGSRFGDLIIGTDGGNRLEGEGGDDTLLGMGGDDLLVGGLGDDGLDGGDGSRDAAGFRTARGSVHVDLTAGTASGQGTDTLVGVENATGSAFGDLLGGDAAANELIGWDGDDQIAGLAGDDYLLGQRGNNTLDGGEGNDICEGGASSCEITTVVDPAFVVRITHPDHGQALPAGSLDRIRGEGFGALEMLRRVDAALQRLTPEGCRWWSARRDALVPRPCNSPLWLRTTFHESGPWALPLDDGLAPGVYRALARGNGSQPSLEGEEIVDFRLT
jgi:Ca2+-binding RTX toxin-like protein